MGLPSTGRIVRGLALGLVAGVLSGLFGIGGGAVLVPGLVLVGLTQHAAHATSLAAIVLTAAAALQPFASAGAVAWPEGAGVAAGALAGTVAGAAAMHRMSPGRLRQAFAVLLVLVALRLLWPVETATAVDPATLDPLRLAAFAALGLAVGAMSALFGVGGGIVMVPALVLLFGFTQHTAEGTSLMVILPTALMGAWRHSRHGYTDWGVGLLVGLGGILGGQAGARVAVVMPSTTLQILFGLFLLVMSLHLVITSRRSPLD